MCTKIDVLPLNNLRISSKKDRKKCEMHYWADERLIFAGEKKIFIAYLNGLIQKFIALVGIINLRGRSSFCFVSGKNSSK